MSKPRFSTICKQAKELLVKIPDKPDLMEVFIKTFPKASEIFFAEGMYWEIYDYEKKYPKAKSSFDAMKVVLDIHKSLPHEVFESITYDALTPSYLFLCGRKAERAILDHKDVVEAMRDQVVHISISNSLQKEEDFVNVSDRPLTKGERSANKGRIIELLKETGNKNVINKLIPALNNTTFFTKAHCNSHHNNYDGALAQHSLGVCINALELAGNTIERSKVILAALLHDLCNIKNFYDKHGNPIYAAKGHGSRSRYILEKLNIGIDKDVLDVIRYHLGPRDRLGDEKRKLSKIWASPLFSVLLVADHMDAGYKHCNEIGFTGTESFISLDCSDLHNLPEFKQYERGIEKIARKYNIQLEKNEFGNTDWNKKKCSMRLLEFGEKPWCDLVPLTGVCRQIAKETKKCVITVSKISINKNNLVLVAELDSSLMSLRNHLQEQIKQQGYDTSFTKNLTIKIAELTNTTGDTAKFLTDLNQYVSHYTFDVDAINLHFFKGFVAGVYYLK